MGFNMFDPQTDYAEGGSGFINNLINPKPTEFGDSALLNTIGFDSTKKEDPPPPPPPPPPEVDGTGKASAGSDASSNWFENILSGGLASVGGIGGGILDKAIFGSGGLVSTLTGSSTTDPISYANQMQQMADARKYDGFTNAAGHLGFGATSDAERAMGQAGNVYASDIAKSNRMMGLGNKMMSSANTAGNAMINSAGMTGQNTLNSILAKNPTMNPAAMAGLAGSMNSSIAGSKLDAFAKANANSQSAMQGASQNTAQAANILGDSRKNYFSNQIAPYLTNYKAPDSSSAIAGLQSGTSQKMQQTAGDNDYTNLLAYITDPLGAKSMTGFMNDEMIRQQNQMNGYKKQEIQYDAQGNAVPKPETKKPDPNFQGGFSPPPPK